MCEKVERQLKEVKLTENEVLICWPVEFLIFYLQMCGKNDFSVDQ